jgi:hypothetical protein
MLAFTHPGKVGDLLYSLPTVRKVCQTKNEVADFYTSDYCYPIVKRLIERQSYINACYLSHTYRIERMDIGVQPWKVPVDVSVYETTYHLGFRNVPDISLPAFIGSSVGVAWDGIISYDYDDVPTLDEPYIVVAPRGMTSFTPLFNEVISTSLIKAVVIGSYMDYTGVGINKCGLDLVDTLPWIAKSKGFLGMMSSQLVLANGFSIPKIAPHDGIHWDMRHVINSPTNFYPINPTAKQVLEIFGL